MVSILNHLPIHAKFTKNGKRMCYLSLFGDLSEDFFVTRFCSRVEVLCVGVSHCEASESRKYMVNKDGI